MYFVRPIYKLRNVTVKVENMYQIICMNKKYAKRKKEKLHQQKRVKKIGYG